MSSVTIPTEIVPQGGGAYLVKPGKPLLGRAKLSIAAAAQRSSLSHDTILRLYSAGILEGERPSPRRIFIYVDSLDAHFAAARDQEFWEQKDERRQRYGEIARSPNHHSARKKPRR